MRLRKYKCKFPSACKKKAIQITRYLVNYSALEEILKVGYVIAFSILSAFMH